MRRLTLGVVCALMLATTAGVLAQGKQDFTLINKTGLTISELYLSPSKVDEWGEDVLGLDVLATGDKAVISFGRGRKACMWDIKIVDDEDDDVIWENIDLCKASEITLKYEGKVPTAIIK
jgi:hypothetical protein